MKQLKERILKDGKCLEGGILKVDNFIIYFFFLASIPRSLWDLSYGTR